MVPPVGGYYPLFPRGPGASTGPLPPRYVLVSRWLDVDEAKLWLANGGTYVPPQIGAGARLYVTEPGAPQPPGTGPIRIDFAIREDSLQVAGRQDWRQIMQPIANVPIHNVVLWVPDTIPSSRITGKP